MPPGRSWGPGVGKFHFRSDICWCLGPEPPVPRLGTAASSVIFLSLRFPTWKVRLIAQPSGLLRGQGGMCWGPPGWISALKGRGPWVCTAVGPGPPAAQGVPQAGMGAQHRARPEEAHPAGGWGAGRILLFVTT